MCPQVIEQQTQRVVKDAAFNGLPRENILKLVSRNGLAIDEFELYQAIVKWATVKAGFDNIEMTPINLRNYIGVQILQKVRFLTMTSAEFSRVYMGFKILSYDEILPIIFNINDKESVPLPETISPSSKHRRSSISPAFFTLKAFKSCNLPHLKTDNRDLIHFSPRGIIKTNGDSITALKIQVPMSIESSQSCCKIMEHFEIFVFDHVGTNIFRKSFNGYPSCDTNVMPSCNGTGINYSNYTNLIDVELEHGFTLRDDYSIQIEFHNSAREYPKLPKLHHTTSCKPRYTRTYTENYYGEDESQEERDNETESTCAVNDFFYLTYV
jgi:BTB And C-terminal Kelch